MATATLVYKLGYDDGPFQDGIKNRALSKGATLDGTKIFLAPIWAAEITSDNVEDTDGTNLDPYMAQLGFSRISSSNTSEISPVTHWGKFSVSNAPTIGVSEGDMGYCTDGNLGAGTLVSNDGSDWIVCSTGAVIAGAPATGPISTASVFSGGLFVGAAGNYTATQLSTSGGGTGAEFTVELNGSGVISSVVSVDLGGSGYSQFDFITLSIIGITETTPSIIGITETTPCVIQVDTII